MIFFLLFTLLFDITYSEKINQISIKGTQQIPDKVILNNISIKKNKEFKLQDLSDSFLTLKNLKYIDNVKLKPIVKNGKLDIEIFIDEKQDIYALLREDGIYTKDEINSGKAPPVVAIIDIDGNYALDDEYVLEKIDILPGSYYSLDRLNLAKAKLEKTGFFNRVYFTSVINEDREIEITFHVDENKYMEANVKIKGNTEISTEKIKAILSDKKNFLLNKNEVQQDIANIQNLYAEEDIVGVEINIGMEGSTLVYEILEPEIGEIYFKKFNYIDNQGQLKTKEYVLKRALSIKSGDKLTKTGIQSSIYNLMRLGFLNNVTPDISKNANDPRKKDITFVIEENLGIILQLCSMNFNFAGDFKLSCGVEDKNFLGREIQAAIQLDVDIKAKSTARILFADPWISGTYGLSYAVEFFRSSEDVKREFGYFNSTTFTGLGLTFGIPILSRDCRLSLKESIKLTDHYNGNTLWDTYLTNSLGLDFTVNLLNNKIDPTSGIFFKMFLSWDRAIPNPSVEYVNFENKPDIINSGLSFRGYVDIIKDTNFIASRLEIGWTKFISKNEIKFAGRSLGGSFNLRGYDHEEFKGDMVLFLNLEDRISIYDSSGIKIEFAFFFDMGTVARNSSLLNIFNIVDYKKSCGVSLRLKNNILPISFNLNFPLDGDNALTLRPEVSVGYIF